MSEIYRKAGGVPLSNSSVGHYLDAINNINRKLAADPKKFGVSSLYEIPTISKLRQVKDLLMNDEDFIEYNRIGHQMYSSGLNRFIEYATGKKFFGVKNKIEVFDKVTPVIEDFAKDAVSTHLERITKAFDRDKAIVAQIAASCEYQCQINTKHETFIAESSKKNYVEVHHIVPLKYQERFESSIDVYANLLVLCPTCHRFLHFGTKKEKEKILVPIYEERSPRFEKCGFPMSRVEFLKYTL